MKINCLGIICALLLNYCTAFSQIPTDSLVAYYPFNGNAKDTSGNRFNGILDGQISVPSTCGSAYYFLNNNIDCGDPPGNEFDLVKDASISLWLKMFSNPFSGYFTLIGKDAGPGAYKKWFLAINGNQLLFHINTSALLDWARQPVFNFVLDSLYHIVVIKSANTYKFYVNGINYGSQTMALNIVDVPASLRVGDLHDGSTKINATIDEVFIYQRALTQTEINQLYVYCPRGVITSAGSLIEDQPGDINIFPNPTIGDFTVKMGLSSGFTNKKIRIINMGGQMIKQLHTRQNSVNMTVDKEGVYLVQIVSDRKVSTKRLMIVAH
jgi:hypothetical protein